MITTKIFKIKSNPWELVDPRLTPNVHLSLKLIKIGFPFKLHNNQANKLMKHYTGFLKVDRNMNKKRSFLKEENLPQSKGMKAWILNNNNRYQA